MFKRKRNSTLFKWDSLSKLSKNDLIPHYIKRNVSLPTIKGSRMTVTKPLGRNFNNRWTKIWSKVMGKDNKAGTTKWHDILLQLDDFGLEKIKSWGIRSGKVRREQMDHSVLGENQIYTSLLVSWSSMNEAGHTFQI